MRSQTKLMTANGLNMKTELKGYIKLFIMYLYIWQIIIKYMYKIFIFRSTSDLYINFIYI